MTTEPTSPNSTAEPAEIVARIKRTREARREMVRCAVFEDGRLDIFARDVLHYEVRPFHKRMIDFQSAGRERLQLAPRGYGKSTLLTIARVVFEIVRNRDIRILLVSDTEGKAVTFGREIKSHLTGNRALIDLFGVFESSERWRENELCVAGRTTTAKEATLTLLGVGGAVAGRHYDLIVCDDLCDEENSATDGQREKLRTWYHKVLTPCLEPGGRLYIVGTRFHHLDLYGHLIANEFADKHQIIRAIEADGSTPWVEKFSLEFLEQKRRELGSIIFNSQYQNDTSLMKGHIFKEEWLRYYGTAETPAPDWGSMRYFIGCDPAATRAATLGKTDSDFWAIVVGAREITPDGKPGRIFVRDVWRDRCSKDAYLQQLRRMNDHYKPLRVGIENVAAQEYLTQDAEKFLPVRRIARTTDKVSRAYWLQAFVENGRVLFPDKSLWNGDGTWQAMLDELLLFPQGDHDDLFDGLQTMVDVAMSARIATPGEESSVAGGRESVFRGRNADLDLFGYMSPPDPFGGLYEW